MISVTCSPSCPALQHDFSDLGPTPPSSGRSLLPMHLKNTRAAPSCSAVMRLYWLFDTQSGSSSNPRQFRRPSPQHHVSSQRSRFPHPCFTKAFSSKHSDSQRTKSRRALQCNDCTQSLHLNQWLSSDQWPAAYTTTRGGCVLSCGRMQHGSPPSRVTSPATHSAMPISTPPVYLLVHVHCP